ncbi:hypothetical protein RHE_CH03983 [Rhizobium etli CFN 42]|uniref:DUF2934 family protein n=2 Tax=Rhizobium etli TaxID=29449 RepID=Q2K359_RHIEC|nr:DUF2934 domain-containing protein [Rhizobium etli]ABC92727.1 hypothetical protein RHE_CH03983 [Rhizobium etli CFN 42]AGS23786.1 hypothetical protein REMIM1_CH04076 [Rhizobium etli bv. mimosae str. Mim1]ARQ12089.1 hypothetical protein NXC12_CH04141 [Rhizobium etli]
MSHNRDAWVSQRAYSLWESEGRPEGRGESHWMQALKEFEQLELTKASPDGNDLIKKMKAAGRLMRVYDRPVPAAENDQQLKAAR